MVMSSRFYSIFIALNMSESGLYSFHAWNRGFTLRHVAILRAETGIVATTSPQMFVWPGILNR